MKRMEMELRYTPMVIYMSDSFKIIKNMDRVFSIGLTCPVEVLSLKNLFSTTKDCGGEDCPMVRACIKR